MGLSILIGGQDRFVTIGMGRRGHRLAVAQQKELRFPPWIQFSLGDYQRPVAIALVAEKLTVFIHTGGP